MKDANKIFGPAQSAVAKAIADAVEEAIIPKDQIENLVVLVSVFIHPEAKDLRKIYQFNYSATKLALRRALINYPSLEKILYDKDRATHPIMGFKVPRLWTPPYLQIAIDITNFGRIEKVLENIPKSDKIILEVGTPLLKKYGTDIVRKIHELKRDKFVVADLKTLDVGKVEVDLAYEQTADAVVVSGLASNQTIKDFISEAKRLGIYAYMDLMQVSDPVDKLKSLDQLPDVVIFHRSIDVERSGGAQVKSRWELIKEVKEAFGNKILCAVAGGINPKTAAVAIENGADIIIVGRYITQAKDVERACREFIPILGADIDLYRVHTE
jgi:bifunctional enzyme Fae/Hps